MVSLPLSDVPSRAPAPVELVSIQYLRAVAALGVVVWHAQGQMGLGETAVLQAGIEIFFVISGYVMWLILSDRPVAPGVFLKKRLARVVPLYWLLTTLMVVLLLIAPRLLQSTRFDLPHVVASYLFVAWPNPVDGVGLKPVMIPGWTLNYEMAFYALLALALAFRKRRRGPIVVGVLSLLALGSLAPLPAIAHFYFSPFMAELALGVLLAMAMKRVPDAWLRGGLAAFGLGCAALIGAAWMDPQGHLRLLSFAIPVVAIVAGLVALEKTGRLPEVPLLKAIGDASYPLYMLHPVLLSAMAQAWRVSGAAPPSPWLYVAISVVVTSVVGWLAHVTLERPLVRLFRTRPSKTPTNSSPPEAASPPLPVLSAALPPTRP